MPTMNMTIHTVFCGECGGWVEPEFESIVPHEGFIKCGCGTILLTVGMVEEFPKEEKSDG